MSEQDTQLVEYQEKSSLLVERGNTIEITDASGMEEATEILSRANKGLDAIKAEKDKVMRPLLDATAAERKRWKPLEDVLGGVVSRIRGLMGIYQTLLKREEEEKKAKIASRVGEGRGQLKAETAINQMDNVEVAEKKIVAESGGVSFRDKQELKVTHLTKIPLAYFDLNESRVLAALKDGVIVPGAQIEVVQIPINKR